MKAINYSVVSLAVLSAMGVANAAGLDRSGQDISAFLQDGTYAEAVYTYIDADVSGHDNGVASGAATNNYTKGNATGDIAEAYDFFRFGAKADINDTFSVGILYDEPFGAAVQYGGNSNFVSQGGDAAMAALTANNATPIPTLAAGQAALTQLRQGFEAVSQLSQGIAAATAAGNTALAAQLQAQLAVVSNQITSATNTTSLAEAQAVATRLGGAVNIATTAEAQQGQGTNVEIRTNNVTALLGAKLGANKNLQIYGGPAAQRLNGKVHLRGIAYQQASGYDARMATDVATGWVAGIAYSKPEIALKAALTYRSEIEHETSIGETFPATGYVDSTDFSVTLPESYNFDFQTGLSAKHRLLGTAKVRYVPWSDFDIRPTEYTRLTTTPIVSYTDDQWTVELGLGKQLTDKLAVSGTVGWDSGAGNPTGTLGPIEGYYSVGLGAKYNMTPNWSVAVGGKYLKFGDATADLPNKMIAGNFEDNDGYIVGVKLAYQDK